jgi:Protein of unknown function (DUF2892)
MFKFKNIGSADRIIRLIAGVAIGLLGMAYGSWLGLIGLVLVLTAGVAICPIYLPFGLSTRKATRVTK